MARIYAGGPDRRSPFPFTTSRLTPDGRLYAYSSFTRRQTFYLVKGLSEGGCRGHRPGPRRSPASARHSLATLGGVVTTRTERRFRAWRFGSDPLPCRVRKERISPGDGTCLRHCPPGDYRVSFMANGMQAASRTVTLPAAAAVRLNQVLLPAGVSQSVTVSAGEAPPERGPKSRRTTADASE